MIMFWKIMWLKNRTLGNFAKGELKKKQVQWNLPENPDWQHNWNLFIQCFSCYRATKKALVFKFVPFSNVTETRMWWKGRVILTAAFLLWRNYSVCPQLGHWSWTDMWHGRGLGLSRTDSPTSVTEMPKECSVRIKWKTIWMQTGGDAARENKLIEESSGPRGLSGRTCCQVCD